MELFSKQIMWKKSALLIYYHLICVALLTYLYKEGEFNGGPCNLGLGLFIFLLLGVVLFILILASIALMSKDRSNKYLLFINLIMLAIWLTAFLTL
jgi:hypothetical protein